MNKMDKMIVVSSITANSGAHPLTEQLTADKGLNASYASSPCNCKESPLQNHEACTLLIVTEV